MKTMDKMMIEIYQKSEHWRFYVDNSDTATPFHSNNQYEDLITCADTLEACINKVWLHYFGSKEYKITTPYFSVTE